MEDWQRITSDKIVLDAISGVKVPLKSTPPLRKATNKELMIGDGYLAIEQAINEMLELGAIIKIPRDSEVYLSKVFTVPKVERGKEYARRFILNLKVCTTL